MPIKLKQIMFFGTAFAAIRMLIGAISVVYLLSRGVDIHNIGLIKSFQAAIILFSDLPLSYLADRKSRKLSVLLGCFFAILWLGLMALAQSLWQFYLAEAFNAISLSLFNGAFLAFLIDSKNQLSPKLNNKVLLGNYNKNQAFIMAVSAFLGAAFVKSNSQGIWLFAAGLMLLLFCYSLWKLPADTFFNSNSNTKKEHTFLSIKKDILKIYQTLKVKKLLRLSLITLIIVSFYFELMVQFWQPLLPVSDKSSGLIFGSIFALILLVQSLASWFLEKFSFALKVGIMVLIFTPILLTFSNTKVIVFISVLLVFFGVKICQLQASAFFHDQVIENRATFDAIYSLINRILVIILFPAITANSGEVLYLTFGAILFLLGILFFVVNFYIKKLSLSDKLV